jgi:hypothetical protein
LGALGLDPQGLDPQGLDPQGLDPQGLDPQGLDPQGLDPRQGLPLAGLGVFEPRAGFVLGGEAGHRLLAKRRLDGHPDGHTAIRPVRPLEGREKLAVRPLSTEVGAGRAVRRTASGVPMAAAVDRLAGAPLSLVHASSICPVGGLRTESSTS